MAPLAMCSSELLQLKSGFLRYLRKIPCSKHIQYRSHCETVHKADIAFVGIGPSGLYGSLRAKTNGVKRVVVVDKNAGMGGTCINFGCVPTKALMFFSNNYYKVKTGFYARHGVMASEVKLDIKKLMCQKSLLMKELSDHLQDIFETLGIKIIRGKARFTAPHELTVATNDGKIAKVEANKVILCTGSHFRPFPGIDIDERVIMSSDGLITMDHVPKRLGVIGTGVIACEMGTCWQRLGSQVTLVSNESMAVGPKLDRDIRIRFQDMLKRLGIKFVFDHKVLGAKKCGNGARMQIEDKEGKKKELDFDVILVCIGRLPYTTGLGLDAVGVKVDEFGSIPVNSNYQTNVDYIFAVGDVSPGPHMAHKALEQGVLCVDNICGKGGCMSLDNVPMVIFTHPEVAAIGKTEDQLKAEKVPYVASYCSMKICARARADTDTTGIMKGLICPKSLRILGTHLLCPHAGELINEITMARQFGLNAEQVCRVVHGHPTYAKMFKSLYGL